MTESDKNSPADGNTTSHNISADPAPALPAIAKSASPLIAVLLLLVAMLSLQGGASLAKTLFPVVGPQG